MRGTKATLGHGRVGNVDASDETRVVRTRASAKEERERTKKRRVRQGIGRGRRRARREGYGTKRKRGEREEEEEPSGKRKSERKRHPSCACACVANRTSWIEGSMDPSSTWSIRSQLDEKEIECMGANHVTLTTMAERTSILTIY